MLSRRRIPLLLALLAFAASLYLPSQAFGLSDSNHPAFQASTPTPTRTPTRRPTRTPTATVTPTRTPTRRATRTPTATITPTRTPTRRTTPSTPTSTPTGSAVSPTATPTAVAIKRYFILAGQSNASGRGELDANTEAPDTRVFMFGNDYAIHKAYEPIDDAINQLDAISLDTIAKHGFALRAGKDLAKAGYGKLAIIPCPKGGSKLEQWWATSNPLDRSTLFGSCNYRRQLFAAGKSISAVWWFQGEAENASDALREAYTANHTKLISDFRQQMGAALPFVYAQLAKNEFPDFNHGYQLIAERQRRLETGSGFPEALAAHYMVVAFDLPIAGGVHLTQAGQKELGRRVALAMQQRVLGAAVEGAGPRLKVTNPVQHPSGDRTRIVVSFNQAINTAVNNYDGQFRVFDANGEVAISSVTRHPSSTSAVRINLVRATVGDTTLSYGDVVPPGENVWLVNVIKGAGNLPAPRFGPIAVAVGGILADASGSDEADLLAAAAGAEDGTATATGTATPTGTTTPTPTESPTPTATPTVYAPPPTDIPTPTDTPTSTPTVTATNGADIPTPTPTPSPTATYTAEDLTPTATPSLAPTANAPQPEASETPSVTPTPSATVTPTATASATSTPDLMPLRLWLPIIRRQR